MQFDLTSLTIVFGIVLAVSVPRAWMTLGARRHLRRWADDNGLTILQEREARFLRGPFTWTTTRTDFVYRLTVRDVRGEEFEG